MGDDDMSTPMKLSGWKAACMICVVLLAIASSAQTFTTLASFDGSNGAAPDDAVVQGFDGNLYGTTVNGGAGENGTVFKITPDGVVTTLYSFCSKLNCSDGCNPAAGLFQATDGNLYGTTPGCGAFGGGTIFSISPMGSMTTVYNFCAQTNCADGRFPGGVSQGSDGNFYGTTLVGGANAGGTVFRITPVGTLTTVYNFCTQPSCADGDQPSGFVPAADGNFYGTTFIGGAFGAGTVFKINPQGVFKTLYSFCALGGDCSDGREPAGLIQGFSGEFFGTTLIGGSSGCASIGCGTAFKITAGSGLQTLHIFCSQPGCADGFQPGALIQGSDGNLYGTTSSGGDNGAGTIFQIARGDIFTTLHQFDGVDGSTPFGGVMQATNGDFYGTTNAGGTDGAGTVFSLSTGISPFAKALPTLGAAGTPVVILGNGLTGTTSVTFHGTPAAFTVVSDTEIQTTVPTGAISGLVQVMTPGGTLTSNTVFRVR